MSVETVEPTTTFGILDSSAIKYKNNIALSIQYKGSTIEYTYQTLKESIDNCACGLLSVGLNKGDKIGIITNNCAEWYILDSAAAQIGVINVSLFPNYSTEDLIHILNDANVSYLFLSNKLFYKMMEPILPFIGKQKGIYTFEKFEGCGHFHDILAHPDNKDYSAKVAEIKATITGDDVYTISYTSGTGGKPKGVEAMHKGIVSAAKSMCKAIAVTENDKALCFLSVAHLYERGHHFGYLYYGAQIHFALSTLSPIDNIKLIKPTVFTSVPLILLTIANALVNDPLLDDETRNKATALAYNYDFGKEDTAEFAELKPLFDSWYNVLGGSIRVISCGGAPMIEKVHRFFWAIGAPIYEAYGLSECFTATYARGREYTRFGTLGAIAEGVEVMLANDGEILCKMPFLMKGFHNLPEYTKQVIDEDGWFHTGDLGEWVDGKFLRLTGRKKDIFKVSSGFYVSPAVVENKIAKSPYILRSIIFDYEGGIGIIFQPEYALFAKEMGISTDNIRLPEYEQAITNKIIDEVSKYYNNFAPNAERVIKYFLDTVERTVENGDLTPTMKVKREKIIRDIFK